jgi:hypothetical protein
MPGKPKPIDKTKTLEHARQKGDLEPFVKDHERDAAGDMDKLDAFLKQATDKKRPARGGKTKAQSEAVHASDCAVHNGPALEAGPCDCGATARG